MTTDTKSTTKDKEFTMEELMEQEKAIREKIDAQAKENAGKAFEEIRDRIKIFAIHFTEDEKEELGLLLGVVRTYGTKARKTPAEKKKYRLVFGNKEEFMWGGRGRYPGNIQPLIDDYKKTEKGKKMAEDKIPFAELAE